MVKMDEKGLFHFTTDNRKIPHFSMRLFAVSRKLQGIILYGVWLWVTKKKVEGGMSRYRK